MTPRIRPLIVGVTAAGLLALPGAAIASAPSRAPSPAPEQSAAAAGRAPTSVEWRTFDRTRAYGSRTVVRGQIITNGGAVRNARVELLRRPKGDSSWNSLGFDRTGNGAFPKFRFSVRTPGNAVYRVTYAGSARYEATAATTSVSAYRKFGAKLEDVTGRFHGKMSPRYARERVYLQKRKCPGCTWRSVDSDRTNRNSTYSFHVGAPRRGHLYWRLMVPGSQRFIVSYSGVYSTSRG